MEPIIRLFFYASYPNKQLDVYLISLHSPHSLLSDSYLNRQLDVYLIFLHTVHTCEYMDQQVGSHTFEPLSSQASIL